MTLKLGRLAGATLLALSLALSAPAFAHNSGGGGGGGGSSGGGGGSSGGGSGSGSGSGGGGSTQTADTATASTAPSMDAIQADIKAANWVKAIADLKLYLRANSRSADAWNLLGYSYRNHGDLKLADSAYDHALKLNPNHIDALSYQGILYVKMGNLDEAKANLARIGKICGNTTCVQYTELAAALG